MNRREFIGGVSALATLGAGAAEGRPLLRIGAMSDDHLHPKRPKTHSRTKACFKLFRKENVDIVVDTGDIADISHVSELEWYRRTYDEIFAGTDTVPFFCIANHDYNYVPGAKKNDPKIIEGAWRALKMDSANPKTVVKGYRFVNVFQHEADRGLLKKTIAEAVAANEGGRPVFVVQHVPPTLEEDSLHATSREIRRVFNGFPQIVALTGHNHRSIKWANDIWQGEFTAVGLGAHAEYSNKIEGEAMILDVYANRIDIRRYEAVTGREIGANDRWSIPLPLDPAHGPYRPAVWAKRHPAPALDAAAKVSFTVSESGEVGVLSFPPAKPRDTVRRYLISFESKADDGSWKFLATVNWASPQVMDEPAEWQCTVPLAMLDGGRLHRAKVVPVSTLKVAGAPRIFEFSVPANSLTELPASALAVARYQRGLQPGKHVFKPGRDGWFKTGKAETLIVLPKAFASAIQKKKRVTIVADLASSQPGAANTISIFKFPASGGRAKKGVASRITTLRGELASNRYVWTLGRKVKIEDGDECAIAIREGDEARFKLNSLRCFVR